MTTPTDPTYPSIAAIVPCHNEAIAIGKVVEDLRKHLPPDATVYVYDNNSTDGTDEVAREAGAVVRYEPNKGKGNVIRRAFADIDADVYLMIDGDDTYEVAAAPDMIAKLFEGPYDHVLGVRRQVADGAYRPGHDLGNRMFNRVVKQIFEVEVRDMLSGYRIFSRRFVKSFPAVSREFEIETELTVHAANLRVPQVEMEVDFRDRPDGAVSKLRTYRDGWKILTLILHLARVERPVLFHSVVAGALAVIGLLLGLPIFIEYFRTGLVPRLPTAVLASVVELVALLVYFLGLQLSALKRVKDENMRLVYLTMDAVRRPPV